MTCPYLVVSYAYAAVPVTAKAMALQAVQHALTAYGAYKLTKKAKKTMTRLLEKAAKRYLEQANKEQDKKAEQAIQRIEKKSASMAQRESEKAVNKFRQAAKKALQKRLDREYIRELDRIERELDEKALAQLK